MLLVYAATKGKVISKNFNVCSTFIDEIFSVFRDLTQSFRMGNWNLHMSAIRRAIPLFFAFDKTHYSRWAPIYLEDCASLQHKFPSIYEHFVGGGFVAL